MASRLFLSLGLLAACVEATALPPAAGSTSQGFMSFPIEHRRSLVPLLKRQDVEVPLQNISVLSYLVTLSIGTPGQRTKVAIDTGSDELWVNPQCSTVQVSSQRAECQANGQYKPSSSSTSKVSDVTNHITYGKGQATIQYVQDSISLPDSSISVTKVVFGAATKTSQLPEGIMGLGFGNGVNLKYNNFVDTLFEQNVTRSRAFTIALGSADVNNGGAIIFGGVDAKRFSGNLTKIPILGPQGKETIRRYWVQLQGISNNNGNGGGKTYTGSSMPIVIDSGSSLSFLPKTVVDQMANDTGAQFDSQAEVYIVPCSLLSSQGSFDFTFGGGGGSATAKISVPYREFIWQAGNECALGAIPLKSGSSGITALLGDSFMRAASITFDQTSNSIYLAQYANCGDGGVRAIAADAAGLAGMTGECSQGQGVGSAAGGNGKKNAAAASPRSLWFGVAVVVAQVVMGVL
ncbi:hypothetical protein MAPG_01994 [Magnaporthiopsis poae ATCC 64411]|uniref:Peptidase A1 domain-containing protein n=1 Tax=Magnaporthiopsis poae (strain ATCC 64411 / 73-15) TaxID=644358 RepID=A0A0C4DQ56_MAGP6|nr:hypothetical protein MAPG_01994 [Magnaporthiopsis poae ATCC 64411]